MAPRGTWMALALAAGALLDLWVALRPNPAPISEEVMAQAAAKLNETVHPGDVIVHSPLFSMAELAALGGIPSKPDVPSPAIMAIRRVVVLDRADHPMRGLGSPKEVVAVPASHGDLEIRVFEPKGGGEAVLYEHVQRIKPETMRVERPPGTVASRCTVPRNEGGYGCPGEADWLHIAQQIMTIEGHEASCVWAHPTTGGAIVHEIPALPPLPPGAHYQLALRAALSDDAVRMTPDGAWVQTEVVEGGAVKGSVTVQNRIGWQEVQVTVDPGLPIELKITTPRDGRRHHCINVDIKEVGR